NGTGVQTCDLPISQTLRKQAGDTILHHPLAKQIIAMTVANHVVNTGGISSVFRAQEETGADARTVVESLLAAQEIFGLEEYRQALETLPSSLDAQLLWQAGYGLRRLTDRLTRWLIYHQRADLTMQQRIDAYQGQVQALLPRLTEMFIGDTKKAFEAERDRLIRAGFPQEVAVKTARIF